MADRLISTQVEPSLGSASPPMSAPSTPPSLAERRSNSTLSMDLTAIPPLSQPSPPSNTLLVTQLDDLHIFHPASLATIRQHITSIAPLHSFSPLKSFRRIICSFYDIESALKIRQHLDGVALLGDSRCRIYFGEPTPLGAAAEKKYLERPDAGRLFFISPPPSPPVGWEMRNEDPPNKEVHAEDLADALSKLSGKMNDLDGEVVEMDAEPTSKMYTIEELQKHQQQQQQPRPHKTSVATTAGGSGPGTGMTRSRSSTIIYDPTTHGDEPSLPAVMVEDMTEEMGEAGAAEAPKIMAHTSRPPVELMDES